MFGSCRSRSTSPPAGPAQGATIGRVAGLRLAGGGVWGACAGLGLLPSPGTGGNQEPGGGSSGGGFGGGWIFAAPFDPPSEPQCRVVKVSGVLSRGCFVDRVGAWCGFGQESVVVPAVESGAESVGVEA